MLEQERQQRKEEEKAAEEARGREEDVKVVATAETERESWKGQPVTTDGEDGNLRILDDGKVEETQGLEASM